MVAGAVNFLLTVQLRFDLRTFQFQVSGAILRINWRDPLHNLNNISHSRNLLREGAQYHVGKTLAVIAVRMFIALQLCLADVILADVIHAT